MTVTNSAARTVQVTNAALADYSFPFKIFKATEIAAIVVNVTTRMQSKLVYGVDFTVSGLNSDAGGTVSLTPAGRAKAGSGNNLVMIRNMDMTQNIDLRPHDLLPAETIERALDILTMEIQETYELASRGVAAPPDRNQAVTWDEMVNLKEAAHSAATRAASEASSSAASALAARTARDQALAAAGGAVRSVNRITPDANGDIALGKSDVGLDRAANLAPADMPVSTAQHERFEAIAKGIRKRLTAAATLYVRPDGNDVNDGSANTAAGALKTLAGAWRRLYALDCAGCAVEVKFAPGTYAAGSFSLAGINCFPALSSADANNKAIFTGRLILTDHNKAQLNRLELQGGLTVDHHSIVYASQCHFNFKGPAGEAIIAAQRNSYLYVQDGCSISGTAGTGLSASQNSMINNWGTLTFNNPVFAGAVMSADRLGCIWTGAALAGNATGKRFQVSNAASIDVQGRGPNAIPGTMAGTVNSATLGVYL